MHIVSKVPFSRFSSVCCFGMEGMETGVRKILIVDDNPEFARMAGRFLEHQGFRIAIADSGYKAVEKIQSEPQDLVLLDLKLPDVTGMEVLKRIKEINDDIGFHRHHRLRRGTGGDRFHEGRGPRFSVETH